MKNRLGILLMGLSLTGMAMAAEQAAFSEHVTQVDDRILLAGALDLDALRAAHDGEIRIVDLRTEGEGAPLEAAAAAELGLDYTNIPVSSAVVDPAQVDLLRGAIGEAGSDELVIVHCRSGNRAGLLYGAAQLEAGVPLADVQQAVSGIVTSEAIAEGLEAYARELDDGE